MVSFDLKKNWIELMTNEIKVGGLGKFSFELLTSNLLMHLYRYLYTLNIAQTTHSLSLSNSDVVGRIIRKTATNIWKKKTDTNEVLHRSLVITCYLLFYSLALFLFLSSARKQND